MIDTCPRDLSATQRHHLQTLARTATRALAKIRAQQQAQAKLETALAEARKAEATKAGFLASMRNELRTPLNAVIGFAQVLESQAFGKMPDPRYVDYAKDIRVSGDHLLELINDILDLSCIQAGKRQLYPEDVDLAEETDWVCRMIAPIAETHGTTIAVDRPDDIARIVWDRRALRQILVNLATNAAKYGGGICEIRFRRAGPCDLTISVSDDDPGIHPDVQATLFRPFAHGEVSMSRETEGTGLGLALCRGLVDLGGGTIALDSAPGKGTRINVTLRGVLCE